MGDLIDIRERLRKKKYGDPAEDLKGRGFPDDMVFGPDDYEEPYEPAPDPIPCQSESIPEEVLNECPDWIRRILNGKEKEEGD